MRHRKKRTRFGRQPAHRKATLRNLARALILKQEIWTTHVKAKEARRLAEKLITVAKENSLSARRKAYRVLGDRTIVSRLFKEIAPLFRDRKGGYTRIIPYDFRKGDGASMVILELTEKTPEEKLPKKKIKEKARKDAGEAGTKEAKKEAPAPRAKPAPEIAPETKEERAVEEVKKQKAIKEDKKIEKKKNFLKKVRGFFRRKTNM